MQLEYRNIPLDLESQPSDFTPSAGEKTPAEIALPAVESQVPNGIDSIETRDSQPLGYTAQKLLLGSTGTRSSCVQ